MKSVLVALTSLALATVALAGAHGSQYQPAGKCGPYPRANVKSPPDTCVAIVAGPEHGLKMPRLIIPLGHSEFILTDMAGWVKANGRVLRLRFGDKGTVRLETIFDKLRQPHGLAMGPDGQVYVGEKGRVSRFRPEASAPALETVAEGFPTDGIHPLTNLIFDKDGALIVNVGAINDRCETKANPKTPQNPCPQTMGDRPRAALWRLTFDKPGGKVVKTEVLARGLRNSMALALDPVTGAIVQAENGVDLPDDDKPAEELNVIVPGKHYGWPSCWGMNKPLPGMKAKDCEGFMPATALLPAHSAPLGMAFHSGHGLPQYNGMLLIAFHGYREQGHRIIALDPEPLRQGKSSIKIENVVSGWDRRRGVRPQGAPVGLAVHPGGSIWWVEDKNRTVMALLESGGAPKIAAAPVTPMAAPQPPPKDWDAFARDVVKPKCAACHVEAKDKDPAKIWAKFSDLGWVGEGALKDSKLARALAGVGPEKPMPPPDGLKADLKAQAAFERLLGANP